MWHVLQSPNPFAKKQGKTNLITSALGQTGEKRWTSSAAALGRVCPHLLSLIAMGGSQVSVRGAKSDLGPPDLTQDLGATHIPPLSCCGILHSNISLMMLSVFCRISLGLWVNGITREIFGIFHSKSGASLNFHKIATDAHPSTAHRSSPIQVTVY